MTLGVGGDAVRWGSVMACEPGSTRRRHFISQEKQTTGGAMKAMRLTLIVCALALTLDSAKAAAQGFQGAVRGLVKDGGGVVPGADVVLVNQATNVARSTTSNETGGAADDQIPGTSRVPAAPEPGSGSPRTSARK